jgi:hypothetical protein
VIRATYRPLLPCNVRPISDFRCVLTEHSGLAFKGHGPLECSDLVFESQYGHSCCLIPCYDLMGHSVGSIAPLNEEIR